MKTIQFTGTEEQISKLQLNSYAFPTEELPKLVEIRVYVVNREEHNTESLSDDMFMTLAEQYGTVYTLKGFQKSFNNVEVISSTIHVIRFISVPLFN